MVTRGLSTPVGDEVGDELAVVEDLVVAAEMGVLVLDGVEAVRADGDDLLDVVAGEGLDVLLGHDLVEVLVAHAPGRVACAALFVAEDSEVDARAFEDGCHGSGRRSGSAFRVLPCSLPRRAPLPSGVGLSVGTSRPSAQSVRVYVVPRHGWPRCSMLMRAFMPLSGISACSIVRLRRMSTIMSMCSTPTGHSWTHAPQVRQSQRASWPIHGPISGLGVVLPLPLPLAMPGPTSRRCSLRFSAMCMGDRVLPLMFAGQASVHRPQTAQA